MTKGFAPSQDSANQRPPQSPLLPTIDAESVQGQWQSQFAESEDPRGSQGVEHPFLSIVMIAILAVIGGAANTQPGSRSRKGFAMAFRRLADFAGLDQSILKELSKLGKGYTSKSVEPRSLPRDEEIVDLWESVKNPAWQWVISILAIYGLRPHEIFRIRTDKIDEDPPILEVEEETKTGWRIVYPSYGKGWDMMAPHIVKYPNIETEGKNNNQLGGKISHEFRELKIPFPPYNLRNAYAQQMYKQGFSDTFIARSMGHSVAVQRSIYRAWWDQDTYDDEYRRVMGLQNKA